MANEFKIKNGYLSEGNSQITGSLNVSAGITGSLFGTSSYAITASHALNLSPTATASYALNALSASYAPDTTFPYTGSARITGSLDVIGTTILTGSLNISGSTTQIGNNHLLGNTTLSGSIQISGSVNALANITLGGTLRLDPAQDPGNTNLTASFLFTSASNTAQGYDLYYRQDGNIVKFKWLEGGISTGLLYGGLVSGSGTTIYVSSGSGIVMTSNASYNEEISPQFTYITWPNYSASATYLTSSQNTYLYVDTAGIVHQQPNYFTETQYQEAICLGRVTHANYTNITGIGSNVQTTYDSDAQQSEFIRAFGPLKINGLTVTGQTGTLRINVGSGTSYNLGGFYRSNADHPSNYSSTATVTGSMARAYRSGSGVYLDNNGGAFYTSIDPTKYDDGSGILQNTGTGNYTIQRVFYNPESKRSVVYYGQERYTTLLNALQYLATDPFEEGEFTAKSLIFVSYLVVKGNTTNLTDINQNSIVQAGLFRNTTGGSGAAGTITLSLENLSDVLITSPVNNQALIYNSGAWINGYPASASYAITASYVLNAVSASYATQTLSSSYAQTASYVLQAVSASFATTASYVQNAQTASYVQTAQTASYVQTAQTASYVLNAQTASYVQNAQTASYVLNAISSSYALSASFATTASYYGGSVTSASFASTASYVNPLVQDVQITGSLFVSQSLDTSARILYDSNSVQSINWNDRALSDSSTQTSVDWENRILYDLYGNEILRYNSPVNGYKIISDTYYLSYLGSQVQENFTNVPQDSTGKVNYEGEIIEGALDGTVVDHNLVYLSSSGTWFPVSQSSDQCTKLLGICVEAAKSLVLLEGSLTVTPNFSVTDSPFVQGLAAGLPIYIKDGSGTYMSTVSPSTAGQYVRVLGHAYYNSTTYTDYWTMKFKPSNDWITI